MLLAAAKSTSLLVDLGHAAEVVLTLGAIAGAVFGLIYYVRSAKGKANADIAKETIENQDKTINAMGAQIAVLERDAEHKDELRHQQDKLIESQAGRIAYLEGVITARDLIEHQGRVMEAGFRHLGVPASVLQIPA
jgi:hypothetical protein